VLNFLTKGTSRWLEGLLQTIAIDVIKVGAIAAIHEGDTLTTQMAVLKRFAKRAPVDTIALRRKVAAAVQSQDRYPLEGR